MQKIRFSNGDSVFFDALKTKVDAYFESNNIRQTGNLKLYVKTAILLISAISIYTALVFFTPPTWLAISLCILMGFNFAGIGFNTMHDAAHGSFSSKTWVNKILSHTLNLMGGDVYLWQSKHNIFHHSFTNIDGMDEDIDIKPWIRVNENQEKFWYHRFQHIYWAILYGTTYLLWIFIQDFIKYFTGKIGDNKFKKMTLQNHIIFWVTKIGYIGVFLIIPILKLGAAQALIGYGIIAFVMGLVIAVVFQLAHVVEDAQFHMPSSEVHNIENEWAIHQISTTADFATKSKIVSWFTGGLNFQVEHHLFPKISHIHYPNISLLVKETCAQFDVNYIEFPTVFKAIQSHVMHLKQVGKAV